MFHPKPRMRRWTRRGLVTGLLVISLVGVSACTADTDSPTAADAELDLLLPAFPLSWDTRSTSGFHLTAQLLIIEPLLRLEPDGTFEPTLAESVEHPDPLTYVYTLRDGVTFSDGSPLTPEDVIYTFGLHSAEDTTSFMARYMAGIESLEATADSEVTVKLSAPDPEWPYTIARMGIVSAAYHEAHPESVGTPDAPQLGTGPYVVEGMTAGTSLELVRNDTYWGEQPRYEAINFEAPADDNARLLALQSGEYDGFLQPPLSQLPALTAAPGYTLTEVPDAATYRIGMDITKAPFDDPAVRRALAHAVDRQAMLDAALGGHGTIANGLVPEELVAALGSSQSVGEAYEALGEQFTYDIDAAAEELADSSVPEGFPLEILVQQTEPPQLLMAQILAQSLAEIGIDVTVRQVDDNTFLSTVISEKSGDGLVIFGANAGSPEPSNMARSAYTPGDFLNMEQFESPTVSTALEEYKHTEDDATKQELLLQIFEEVQAVTPYVPVFQPYVAAIIADQFVIEGFTAFWWASRIDEMIVPAS